MSLDLRQWLCISGSALALPVPARTFSATAKSYASNNNNNSIIISGVSQGSLLGLKLFSLYLLSLGQLVSKFKAIN